MGITFEKLREFTNCEYSNLCDKLDLKPVPLHIYSVEPDSTEVSDYGVPLCDTNALYGWSEKFQSKVIILPVNAGDLDVLSSKVPSFPPSIWDRGDPAEWPPWRTDLWEETCHQVEDQILGEWQAGDEHGDSFKKALDIVAEEFGIDFNKLWTLLGYSY